MKRGGCSAGQCQRAKCTKLKRIRFRTEKLDPMLHPYWKQPCIQRGADLVHDMRSASFLSAQLLFGSTYAAGRPKLPEAEMTNHDLLVDFWRNVIAENVPSFSDCREAGICVEGKSALCQLLAAFLVKNDFTKVDQLKQADHPSEWIGADALSRDELELVWSLRKVARRRSRKGCLDEESDCCEEQ